MRASWQDVLGRIRIAPPSRFADVLFVRPRFVWIGLAVPMVMIVASVWFGNLCGEPLDWSLQVAGFLIGLAGLLVVARGLSNTRRVFGRPRLSSRVRGWSRDAIGLVVEGRRQSVSVDCSAAYAIAGAGTAAVVTTASTLEQRIEELERRAAAAEQKIEEVRDEAKRRLDDIRAALLNEDTEIRASVAALRKQVEDFSVGGLDLEGMGLFWLMFGAFLSTFYGWVATWSLWRVFL